MAWQFLRGPQNSPSTDSTTRQGNNQTNSQPITLNFWGVFDDPSIFGPFIQAYQNQHPNVTVTYTRKDASLYEFASLNLLASQEGPDIWLVPLEWLPKHRDKFRPVPTNFLADQAGLIKKPGLFQRPSPAPSNSDLYTQLFAPATAEGNLSNDQLATIPLSLDTLGLYGNTALLKAAGVERLPATWEELLEVVKRLAKRETFSLTQPAIGLGASNNVSRATDILATLMIQNQTPMISTDGREALYSQAITKATGEPFQPGLAALDFYTSFASPTKENFSWAANQPNDFELFVQGKLPLLIDYSYRVNDISQQNPNLTFTTSPLPQITGTGSPMTLGTAQMVGVPLVSKKSDAAWNFIAFLTNQTNSLAYSRAAGRPPARLALLGDPALETHLRTFAAQAPIARTWHRNEVHKTDAVFKQAIDAVLAGQPLPDVLQKLSKQVTHILRNEPTE